MKKSKQLFLYILIILIISIVTFYIFTKNNIEYEYIGSIESHSFDGEFVEGEYKEKGALKGMWYEKLKGKIENGQWKNKEIKENEKEFNGKKIKTVKEFYMDFERGNNGYMTFFEEDEMTYLAITPGASVTTLYDLKVKRIYEKDGQIIIDLDTINAFDLAMEYRILFISMKTSGIKGKDIIVKRNVRIFSEMDTMKDYFLSSR